MSQGSSCVWCQRIFKLILPIMASENTVFSEKLAEAVAIIPTSTTNPGSDDFEVTNKKKPFVLVLVSEHSQVSELNAAVIRKLWVKSIWHLQSSKSSRRISSSAILKIHSGAHCACRVYHFPCAYATSVNIRYDMFMLVLMLM